MTNIYNQHYEKFNTKTLKDIHRIIFGQIYDRAGEFRTIQMIEPEDFDAVLGDDKLTILDNLVGIIPVQEAVDRSTIKEERLARK